MLSFQKGRPIAIILGGSMNKKILRIYQEKKDDDKKLLKVLNNDYSDDKPKKAGKVNKKVKRKVESESEYEDESEYSDEFEGDSEESVDDEDIEEGFRSAEKKRTIKKRPVYRGGMMENDDEISSGDEGGIVDVYDEESEEEERLVHNPMSLMSKRTFKGIKYKPEDELLLKEYLMQRKKPKGIRSGGKIDENLIKMYEKAKEVIDMKQEIIITDGMLYPVPLYEKGDKQREILYVAGPSGSGKSSFLASYARFYKNKFPNNPVFLFSAKPEDELLDKVGVNRIKLDAEFIKDPPKCQEFKNSLVLFDDTENIGVGSKISVEVPDEKKGKKMKKVKDSEVRRAVSDVRDLLLETGRSSNITMGITAHNLTDYQKSRKILVEATSVTFFPEKSSTAGIEYWMTKYGGFNREEREKILKLRSRWVTCYTCGDLPPYVLTQNECFLLQTMREKLALKKKKSKS